MDRNSYIRNGYQNLLWSCWVGQFSFQPALPAFAIKFSFVDDRDIGVPCGLV